jgi:DNA invertase Pin-like site-specific DNA recombinase
MARHKKTVRNPQSPRVLCYSRVSTEEQAASGLGLSAQRETLKAEAVRRGWTDVRFVVDDGHSAASLDRPGIQQALAALASGQADVLVAAKLDRISRSLMDFAGLMECARREGWTLIALDLGVDTSTAAGEMMAAVLASFAQYERRLIAERTAAALQALKRSGKRLGRPVTLRDEVRQRIARERAAGMTLQAIADGLRRAGVLTARGGEWTTSSVQKALLSVALDRAA